MSRIPNILDKVSVIFEATNDVLNEWKLSRQGDVCYKIPELVAQLAVKLNWNDKEVRENDALVRFFLRNNPDLFVTRGARGGVKFIEDQQARQAAQSSKTALKAQLKAKIEASAVGVPTDEVEESDHE